MAYEFTLYSYWRSSSSWRVRLMLAAKGITYETIPVHLERDGGEQHAPDFADVNPMRQIPFLQVTQDGGVVHGAAQSIAIMELLEELVPEPALFPADPFGRAKARQLAELVNSGIQPLQNLAVIQHLRDNLNVDARAFCRHWIDRGLHAYQDSLAEDDSKFSIGDTPTIADFCLVPQLYNARRFKLDMSHFPRLLEIEAAVEALDYAAAAHPDNQPDFDPDA